MLKNKANSVCISEVFDFWNSHSFSGSFSYFASLLSASTDCILQVQTCKIKMLQFVLLLAGSCQPILVHNSLFHSSSHTVSWVPSPVFSILWPLRILSDQWAVLIIPIQFVFQVSWEISTNLSFVCLYLAILYEHGRTSDYVKLKSFLVYDNICMWFTVFIG